MHLVAVETCRDERISFTLTGRGSHSVIKGPLNAQSVNKVILVVFNFGCELPLMLHEFFDFIVEFDDHLDLVFFEIISDLWESRVGFWALI